MRIGARERKFIIITIVIACLSILQMLVVRPAFLKLRKISGKLATSRAELQRMRQAADKKEHLVSTYDAIRSRITSDKTPEREIIGMLLSVEKVALDSGVQIIQNAHVKDEPLRYFSKHTVEFRGKGKMQNLMQMLYSLQDERLLLKVPKLNFAIKNHELEMNLEITRIVCPKANGNG